MKTHYRLHSPRRFGFFAGALTIAINLFHPSPAQSQTQTYPCETVMKFGTGMSTNGIKLPLASIDPSFDGTSVNFPARPDVFVVTNPAAAWIANSASTGSQWIGPSVSTADDAAGTYVYQLQFTTPCAGASVTGRYAAGDRGVLRLNGAAINFPTPSTGWTSWTAFAFSNLPVGSNNLEFYVTNTPTAGGPAGPSGLRAELTVTAICCPCIELTCPSDIFLKTCSNGAPANFTITGTNRCYTNLTISCALTSGTPVTNGFVFPVGTNNVLCTATDTVGHRTNCSFKVIVARDNLPPEIRCPRDIVYLCGVTGTNVFYNVTVTDDTDPAPVVTCVPPSGSFFPVGTTTVLCEARDACGRVSRCSFKVIIAPQGFPKTLQAGVADNFLPSGLEATSTGPCLGGSGFWSGMPFDTSWPGRQLSHSFQGLPNNIATAKLILHMKPTQPASQDDVLRIGLVNCGGAGVWAFAQPVASLPGANGTWNTNPPTTFALDLAALPGGVNLLTNLNAAHRLEFAVGTETMVDYARLELTYCGPTTTLSGVPYSMQNVYPIHQGGGGVSWRTVNSNDPPIIDIDAGGADGMRLEFADGLIIPCIRVQLPGLAMPAVATILDEPFTSQTRISVSQPSNSIGKSIEVWNAGRLVSRHFLAGPGDIAALVPANALVRRVGMQPCVFEAEFQQPISINILSGISTDGLPGPIVTGDTIRLSYLGDPGGSEAGVVRMTLLGGRLDVSQLSLLWQGDWFQGYGNQQLTVSDALISKTLADFLDSLYGDCINALPGWSIGLQNPVADFCEFDGISETCSGGYVDVNIKAGLNFGGLRLTPTFLPWDVCRIDNTVANSTANSVVITRTVGSPVTLNNVTTVESLHWPTKVSGTGGPQSFTVDLPTNTTVTANGQTYNATRVTFNAQPLVLAEYYQVCIETVTALQISMYSLHAPPTNSPAPPCLTLTCPTGVVVNCTGAGTVVTFNPIGATRCGSNVVITCVPPSGSLFPPGVTVVQCSAIDSRGNQDECRFLVTVRDVTPPQLVMPARIIVPCTSPRGAVVEFTASALDTCDPAVVVECRPPSGSLFPVGTNYVTCTAVDAGGNRSSQEFPVIVAGGCAVGNCVEVTVPPDIETRCNTAGGAVVNFAATARDLCTGGSLSVMCAPPSGSLFPVGLTRVVCSAQSGSNSASASFMVEVIDDTPPVLTCPSNLIVAAQSERGAVVTFTATGRDNCAPQVRVRCTPASGSVFPVGQTQVFCEGTDGHGNVGQCTFTVTVNRPEPLQVTRLSSGLFELRWTGDAVVEVTAILSDGAVWRTLSGTPESNGVERVLRIPPSGGQSFFRLRLLALLPPADTDGDGMPDLRDRCPKTPAGLPVDQYGCALFDLITTPERVFDPERAAGSATLRLLQFDGGFTDLVSRLSSALVNSNSPSMPLRERLLPGALKFESNFVYLVRGVLNDFLAQKGRRIADIERTIVPLDAAHADVRPQDWELMRLEEIEEGLLDVLSQSETSLINLSNVVKALDTRERRSVTIQSFDVARGTALLTDGRLIVLPRPGSPGAPPLELIRGVFNGGSAVQVDVSQLADGTWFGHSAEAQFPVNPGVIQKLDPRTLALRIVPANLSLPDWDTGVRHRPRAYKWGFTADSGYHFLEYGMAFAVVKLNSPNEPGFSHWVQIKKDADNDGVFGALVDSMTENSPPFVLTKDDLPENQFFPIVVREFRAPIQAGGSLGTPELVAEETLLIEMYDWGHFAEAIYSRTNFELEDDPNETSFQTAQVEGLIQSFPLSLQSINQQTFKAWSFTVSGNNSSYPDISPIQLNTSFAVHFQDPNDQLFFAHPNDLKRGLNEPTVSGINHGRPFTYRVTLPKIVRDRLHACSGTDTYYRIPFSGEWEVSQGNNGDFTHTNKQKYAFDFPKNLGVNVRAARGGIVTLAKESSSQSCFNGSACVSCTGSASANAIRILHQDGTEGVYVHFRQNGVFVNVGQRVYRGDLLGKVGTTGCSTGPHLHFHVVEETGSGVTIPIKFEAYDDDDVLRNCYVPPHNSNGTSTNP